MKKFLFHSLSFVPKQISFDLSINYFSNVNVVLYHFDAGFKAVLNTIAELYLPLIFSATNFLMFVQYSFKEWISIQFLQNYSVT